MVHGQGRLPTGVPGEVQGGHGIPGHGTRRHIPGLNSTLGLVMPGIGSGRRSPGHVMLLTGRRREEVSRPRYALTGRREEVSRPRYDLTYQGRREEVSRPRYDLNYLGRRRRSPGLVMTLIT